MIQVDISNIWGQASLPELLSLEEDISAGHMALTQREDLRQLLFPQPDLTAIENEAREIAKDSRALVVLGSGGAPSAIKGILELLQGADRNLEPSRQDLQVLFAGSSFSGRQLSQLNRILANRDYSLCVLGGAQAAAEVFVTLRSLKWAMERKYGTDRAKQRIWAVTDSDSSPLGQMAKEEGWRCMTDPGVDSQFSLFGPAVLLPLSAAGVDIHALVRGGAQIREDLDLRSFENPLWLYTGVRYLMQRKSRSMELLTCGEPDIRSLGIWWQQLFARSGGKALPIAAVIPQDQENLGRLLNEGSGSFFETALHFETPGLQTPIWPDIRDLDALNFLAEKNLEEVQDRACQAGAEEHAMSGISVLALECGLIQEETLGELLTFFTLAAALLACAQGSDPMDRSAAESYRGNLLVPLGWKTGE